MMSNINFSHIYTSLYKEIFYHSKNLDLFVSKNENLSDFYKSAAKSIFDFSTKEIQISTNSDLPELLIEGYDLEQIWQQINLKTKALHHLQNVLLLPFSVNLRKRSRDVLSTRDVALNLKKKVRFSDVQFDDGGSSDDNLLIDDDVPDDDNDNLVNDKIISDDENLNKIIDENASIFKDGVDSDQEEDENLRKVLAEYKQKLQQVDENGEGDKSDENDEDDEIQEADLPSDNDDNNDYGDPLVRLKDAIEDSKSKKNCTQNVAKIEDRFLNLKQMEDFVNEAETKRPHDEKSDEEMSMDDFSDDEKNANYEDFFKNSDEDRKSREQGLLESSSDKSAGKEILPMRELIRDADINLSTLEKRSISMQKKISELETENLATVKPWQMKGEITAKSRPENSLLEEVLDFDTTTKPAPLITEEVTKSIEDKIIERLKSNVWDGPKRKVKVKESDFTLKKKIILDQEKSQLSLEQIYENEYMQQNQTDEKEPEEFDAIRKSMTSLFRKLDALSNFHYTPKPAIPDLKIISNVQSMLVEEAIPVAISNAMLLAPQEILEKKKGDLVGTTELSKCDKLRSRRSKKKRQHFKRLDKERTDKIKKTKTDKAKLVSNTMVNA